jgi:hypothetical protein
MKFLTCHLFGVFASYFDFAAFSRLAFPAPTRRKTFKTAAEHSSFRHSKKSLKKTTFVLYIGHN